MPIEGWYDVAGNPVMLAQQLNAAGAPPNFMQPLQPLPEDVELNALLPDQPPIFVPPPAPPKKLDPNWTRDPALLLKWRTLPANWPVKERPGSGKISMTKAGITGTRIFEVPWVFPGNFTYLDYCQRLLGWTFTNAQNGLPIIIPPDVFSNELNWLLCQELEVGNDQGLIAGYEGNNADKVRAWPSIPQQAANGSIFPNFNNAARLFPTGGDPTPDIFPAPLSPRAMYNYAVITAKYAPFDIGESITLSGKSLSMPKDAFVWTSETDPTAEINNGRVVGAGMIGVDVGTLPCTRVNETVSIVFPMAEHKIERRQVWEINIAQIMKMIGCVNEVQFLHYPARTILFLGLEAKKTYFPNGTRLWDLNISLQYNPNEHVKFMRRDRGYEGQWWYMKLPVTNKFIYELADLNLLLTWS